MELAICFGGLDTPEATAQKLLENGAHIIETMWGFFSDSDDDKIGNTARIFKDKGIFIRSVHAPFGGNYNIASTDDELRGKALQANFDLLPKLSKIGVEMVVVHPGLGGDNWQKEKEKIVNLASESIAKLAIAAEETGIQIAVENMLPGHPGCESGHILEILERVNSPLVGVCFDSGHAHICGNMKEFMEAVGEHIISIHMQDNDGTKDSHIQPPYGTTDWRAFAEVLRKIKYDRPITVETAPWGGASYKQLIKEVSALLESMEDVSPPPDEWQGSRANMSLRCYKCGHAILKSGGRWFCKCK